MKRRIHVILILIALFGIIISTVTDTIVSYGLFEKQVLDDLRISGELLKSTGVFDEAYKSKDKTEAVKDDAFGDVIKEELRITWVDKDGTVIYDNDVDPATLDNHKDRPEIRDALKSGSGEVVRTSDTFQYNSYYYAMRLDNGTVLRISRQASAITRVFLHAFPTVALISLAILIVCTILASKLTKQIIAPINEMGDALNNNKEGQLTAPKYRELIPFANNIRRQHEEILMAAKSRQDFTANVSHELKTPLTAISGYAELIENRMVDEEKQVYFAGQIQANANRLLSMINDIISLSELDHSELERIFVDADIYKLARECCDEVEVNGSHKHITVNCSGESVIRRVDANLIKEMITNLLQNAMAYNKSHGRVDVSVKASGEQALITISDTGIGIPEEHIDRVFERFYRVDKSRSRETGGTGLGLALVKHIVEIHNAELHVDSEVGVGTTFTIRL